MARAVSPKGSAAPSRVNITERAPQPSHQAVTEPLRRPTTSSRSRSKVISSLLFATRVSSVSRAFACRMRAPVRRRSLGLLQGGAEHRQPACADLKLPLDKAHVRAGFDDEPADLKRDHTLAGDVDVEEDPDVGLRLPL